MGPTFGRSSCPARRMETWSKLKGELTSAFSTKVLRVVPPVAVNGHHAAGAW